MDRRSRTFGPLLLLRQRDQRPGLAAASVRRPWWIAILVSVTFHLLLAVFLLYFVRSKPVGPSENPLGTVELLMVEKRGSGTPTPPNPSANKAPPSPSPPPSPPAMRATPPDPAPPKPPDQAAAAQSSPPAVSDEAGEPVPPAAPAAPEPPKAAPDPTPKVDPQPQEEAKAAERPAPKVAPAPPQEAPVFNLDGTDSESNAIVMGNQVIPASPDDRFRNRPPIYPYDAAVRGEHGSVVVVIHVSENGVSTGADVAATSGVVSLDDAALNAVRKWHFRPAMKDGRTVPFDMPMRFIFEAE